MYGNRALDRVYEETFSFEKRHGASDKEADILARDAVEREQQYLSFRPSSGGDRSMYGAD